MFARVCLRQRVAIEKLPRLPSPTIHAMRANYEQAKEDRHAQ